jgi:hypothetical protein
VKNSQRKFPHGDSDEQNMLIASELMLLPRGSCYNNNNNNNNNNTVLGENRALKIQRKCCFG